MGILNLFFDFNSQLWYSILFSILFILLVFLDRMLFNLIPNFLVGLSGLLALGSWIYYFSGNFIKNLWIQPLGKGIILAVSFIIISLLITGEFGKRKQTITQVGETISPTKWGQKIKNIRR